MRAQGLVVAFVVVFSGCVGAITPHHAAILPKDVTVHLENQGKGDARAWVNVTRGSEILVSESHLIAQGESVDVDTTMLVNETHVVVVEVSYPSIGTTTPDTARAILDPYKCRDQDSVSVLAVFRGGSGVLVKDAPPIGTFKASC